MISLSKNFIIRTLIALAVFCFIIGCPGFTSNTWGIYNWGIYTNGFNQMPYNSNLTISSQQSPFGTVNSYPFNLSFYSSSPVFYNNLYNRQLNSYTYAGNNVAAGYNNLTNNQGTYLNYQNFWGNPTNSSLGFLGYAGGFLGPVTGFGYNYGGYNRFGFYNPFFPSFNLYDYPVSSNNQQPTNQDSLSPKPGDELLTRGNAYINETDLLILESYPAQIRLHVIGNLPDPCHQLRAVVNAPDSMNRIYVEIYSLVDPSDTCAAVLKDFDVTINIGSFTHGQFSVIVNNVITEVFSL